MAKEHYQGEERRLASQKQETLTGGDVNYYLTDVGMGTIVENDDVNEVLRLSFAQGTSFKSVTRLCKLRMSLGKPGSTTDYEIGKVVYYNKRTHATSLFDEQQIRGLGKAFRWVRDLLFKGYFDNINDVIIEVPSPKRLRPYSFRVGDFIFALKPSYVERQILENIFKVALMRQVVGPLRADEVEATKMGVHHAEILEQMLKCGDYC